MRGEITPDAPARRISNGFAWFVGRPWVIIGLVVLFAFGLWARGTRTQGHHVRVVFDSAVSLYSGLDVRVDGLDAGKINKVAIQGGKAVVTLGISDDQVWPLHQGTKAVLRYGSTIGNGTRLIDLQLGPASAPEIPENGIIADRNTVEATEFDDVFDTFDAKTRAGLRGTLKATGDTFGPRAKALGDGVSASAPGLESIAGFAADLARDDVALHALVTNTDRVTRTLVSRRGAISDLVQVSAATFAEFASNTSGITASLDRFPSTMRETRGTLDRLDGSLDRLNNLVADVGPGAAELGRLSVDLRPAVAELRRTVGPAVATFRTARATAPRITALLRAAQPFADKASPIFTRMAPIVGCIRPYAPEIAGLMSTWTSFTSEHDHVSHFGRLWGNFGPTSLTSTPADPATFTKLTGQNYALVHPPGYNAGKPWFIPECGATADYLDPAKDPEVGS
jgi:phospholipid/cholesterol/gamma-HCH transport system substrate-binding protein